MADDEKHEKPDSTPPPGHFVSENDRTETARFLEEVRKRLQRKKPESEPKLGPPKRPR